VREDRQRLADVVVTDPVPDAPTPIATTDTLPLSEADLLRTGERFSLRLRDHIGEDWSEGA